MKNSESGNKILPNTFQHPNIFIDELMYYLTPEENVVLTFAVRRILGFQENISTRKDNISLSQFTGEIRSTKNGRVLSKGCGLGVTAVRDALDILLHCRILLPTTAKPDPRKGQEYWLQEDESAIDWDWLEKRKAEKHESSLKRTEKARCSVGQKSAVGQQSSDTVPQQASVLSDNNTKPTETQGNPKEEDAELAAKIESLKTLHEQNVGFVTPLLMKLFRNAALIYPIEWYQPAFEIMVKSAKHRSWAFVEAVLIGWRDNGFGWKPTSNKNSKQPAVPVEDNFMQELEAKRARLRAEANV